MAIGTAHPCCGGHTYHMDHCYTLADKFDVCGGCGHYRGEHDSLRCNCIVVDMTGEHPCTCRRFRARASAQPERP